MGKRGASPIPALREIKGTAGKGTYIEQPAPVAVYEAGDCPMPSDDLDERAREQWLSVCHVLHRAGVLNESDRVAFTQYCLAYSNWSRLQRTFNEMAAADPVTHGVLVQGLHSMVKNPLYRELQIASKELMALAQQFGLTPASRGRMYVEEKGAGNANQKYFGT